MPELPTFVAWPRRQRPRHVHGRDGSPGAGAGFADLVGFVHEHPDLPDGAGFRELFGLLTTRGALVPGPSGRPDVQLASLRAAHERYQHQAAPPDPRRRRVRLTAAPGSRSGIYLLDARTAERLAAFQRREWAEAFVACMGWQLEPDAVNHPPAPR